MNYDGNNHWGLITFITTNIDDIFILALFYGDKKYANSEIIKGQVLGISALVAISLIASLMGLLVHKSIIGLFGLFRAKRNFEIIK